MHDDEILDDERPQPERAWLGVVSADHARRAVAQHMIQLNHGKRYNVARLRRGDGFVFYSPTEQRGDRAKLRAFTAIGSIADDEPYLAEEPMHMGARGMVRPWRRRVDFADAHPVGLTDLADALLLTQRPSWGYELRYGLVPLSTTDFRVLEKAMTALVVPAARPDRS